MYEIKLTSSNLYLTLSGSNVIWSAYNSTNRSNQIWKLAEQPANLHNGVDTASILDDQTIRALKLGNVKFVIRYYSQYSWKVLTNAEAANLHNRGIQIISIFQDSGTNVGEFTEDKANDNADVYKRQEPNSGSSLPRQKARHTPSAPPGSWILKGICIAAAPVWSHPTMILPAKSTSALCSISLPARPIISGSGLMGMGPAFYPVCLF